jgi:succinyl-CoA synthetase beta subunit
MDLLEFQGKQLFGRAGVPVPEGRVAATPDEARRAADELGGRVVVKAQVPTGGRGKAGGIKVAADPAAAATAAATILGMDLKGHRVDLVWVERATDIAAEWYVSFTLDRGVGKHLAMVSARGGMDIEAVAKADPAAVVRRHVDPVMGLAGWEASELAYRAGLDRAAARPAAAVLRRLYRAFVDLDCDLVEVNPLVLTAAGEVVALDAKVSLDGNAFFRHPEFEAFRAVLHEDPLEGLAREKDLGFIKLSGSVGIIGNGAGLVMSTLDVISLVGGAAANFLDLGGGARPERIAAALDLLTHDPAVRAVLVNVFGGITRCDLVAEGIVAALGMRPLPWPIVVRLDGTNAEQGRAILAQAPSGGVTLSATMLEAAQRVVELAGRS